MHSVVVATNNKGKMAEITRELGMEGWQFLTLTSLGIAHTPKEDGQAYEDNARIKVQAARTQVLSKAAVAKAMQAAQRVPRVAQVMPPSASATVLRATDKPLAYLADDSGLEVYALNGRPGIHSARYALEDASAGGVGGAGGFGAGLGAGLGMEDKAQTQALDSRNVDKLLEELKDLDPAQRGARFVCTMVYLTEDGQEIVCQGTCEGRIALAPTGDAGFGYDPVFVPDAIADGRTMAQLSPEEKDAISHRGSALRALSDELSAYYGQAGPPSEEGDARF